MISHMPQEILVLECLQQGKYLQISVSQNPWQPGDGGGRGEADQ